MLQGNHSHVFLLLLLDALMHAGKNSLSDEGTETVKKSHSFLVLLRTQTLRSKKK